MTRNIIGNKVSCFEASTHCISIYIYLLLGCYQSHNNQKEYFYVEGIQISSDSIVNQVKDF